MNKGSKGTGKPTGLGSAAATSGSLGSGNPGAGGTTNVRGHGSAGSHGSFNSGATAPRARRPRGFNVGGDHG